MKYTALTIGPIYRSINEGRKLREIWGASYLFASLMKKIVEYLKNEQKGNSFKFIIPNPEMGAFEPPKETGLFPDRLILESKNGVYELVEEAVREAAEFLKDQFRATGCRDNEIEEYLNHYFTFNIVEKEMEKGQNPVFEMNRYMAMTELQEKAPPEDPLCFLRFLLNIPSTSLYKNVFENKRSFSSIIEISARKITDDKEALDDLEKIFENQMDEEKEDDNIIQDILNNKKLKESFKQPHKYIAIVQSDGDNVGKLIGQIFSYDPNLIQAFSKQLSSFAAKASQKINAYGGNTVYAGGDDLLFFAPVLTTDSNIFKLIEELDRVFKEEILENKELKNVIDKMDKKPSMSYGVSLSYYKFPMNEALNQARNQLFKVAKKDKKNNIAYMWLKHSGQSFHDVIHKDENNSFYNHFKKLMETPTEVNLLSSLIYNLKEHKPILKEIICDKTKLDNYFDNFYDESVHKKNNNTIDLVKNLLIDAYEQTQNVEKAVNKVYAMLRFVKFLNQKASDE